MEDLPGLNLRRMVQEPGREPNSHREERPKVLDHKGYSRQVRMAVVEFSDFWSRGDCLNELQRRQAALTQTEPFHTSGRSDAEEH
jgi:hypothetical protein